MDATGSKMEAIVSGENAARFKNILIVGQKYTIHDIAGVIVYLGPLQRVSNRLYREVTLLDTRCDLVVIGVYANHLTTHVLQWASAIAKNHVVVGTMLQLDCMYWCLESSDHSQFYFNPSYHKVHELQNFRRYVVNGEVNLGFVDRCHVTRWLHIAEVLDSKSSFKTNNRNS
uniref:Uncharacterized protein n=1 Tax=Oryza punctata TaxID=4537 RepID=A0A0E0LZ70_ORYPU